MKVFLAIFLMLVITSCQKESDQPNSGCTADIATMTGTYTVSKVQIKNNNILTDVTALFASQYPCKAAGIYNLRADRTVVYTDPSNCGEDNIGAWSVSNGTVTLSYPQTGTSFVSPVGDNCTTITIPLENAGNTAYYITIRRQ